MKKRNMLTFSEFVRANQEFEALAEITDELNRERIRDAFYQRLKVVRQRVSEKRSSR